MNRPAAGSPSTTPATPPAIRGCVKAPPAHHSLVQRDPGPPGGEQQKREGRRRPRHELGSSHEVTGTGSVSGKSWAVTVTPARTSAGEVVTILFGQEDVAQHRGGAGARVESTEVDGTGQSQCDQAPGAGQIAHQEHDAFGTVGVV